MRDPMRFARRVLIIPPPLVPLPRDLRRRDGRGRREGRAGPRRGRRARRRRSWTTCSRALSGAGFLRDDAYARAARGQGAGLRGGRRAASRRTPVRRYPDEAAALERTLAGYLEGRAAAAEPGLVGDRGAARQPRGRLALVRGRVRRPGAGDWPTAPSSILGTSHYGEPERSASPRKPFAHAVRARRSVDADLVDELRARAAPPCGPRTTATRSSTRSSSRSCSCSTCSARASACCRSCAGRSRGPPAAAACPRTTRACARFLDALGARGARASGDRLLLRARRRPRARGPALRGPRAARADERGMIRVAERDRERLERIRVGDATASGGSSRRAPTTSSGAGPRRSTPSSRTVARARGELLDYEQWNIDDESVVTFAGLAVPAREKGRADETRAQDVLAAGARARSWSARRRGGDKDKAKAKAAGTAAPVPRGRLGHRGRRGHHRRGHGEGRRRALPDAFKSQEYAAKRDLIEGAIGQKLLENEAKKRGITVDELRKQEVESKVEAVTRRRRPRSSTSRTRPASGTLTEAEALDQIQKGLGQQRLQRKLAEYVGELRAKASVQASCSTRTASTSWPRRRSRRRGPADRARHDRRVLGLPVPVLRAGRARAEARRGDLRREGARRLPATSRCSRSTTNAAKAAEAGACAADQGKFWEMHDKIFANQAEAGGRRPEAARQGGRPGRGRVRRSASTPASRPRSGRPDTADGERYGVTGTPAVLHQRPPAPGRRGASRR